MGRRCENTVITEENRMLAEEFMKVIGKHYNDYIKLFRTMFTEIDGSDVAAETLLKCHSSIQRNGMKKLSEEKEKRENDFKNYFFISAKMNYLTMASEKARKTCEIIDWKMADYIKDDITAEQKQEMDFYNDYKVVWIVDKVENKFDPITFRCWRLKYLIKGMTYQRTKEITGIGNTKSRITMVQKWLKDNVTEDMIRKDFDNEYNR